MRISFLFLCVAATSSQIFGVNPALLVGEIKSDGASIPLFFGGYRTRSDTQGFYSFRLNATPGSVLLTPRAPLYLLISESAKWKYERTNTITALSQDRNEPYLFYSINYIEDEDGKRLLVPTPERLESRDFQIPPECCIWIPLDPDLVDTLEPWTSPTSEHIANFPTITLKKMPDIQLQSAATLMASLDLTPFHEKASTTREAKETKRGQKVVISVTR